MSDSHSRATQLHLSSELIPDHTVLLRKIQDGMADANLCDLFFDQMPDTTLDDRALRRALNELMVTRVWNEVNLQRVDDPDFEYVLERSLMMNCIQQLSVGVHYGYNFTPCRLGSCLKNGLQHTTALTSLSLSVVRICKDTAMLLSEGFERCKSLLALEIVCIIYDSDETIHHLGQGIKQNQSIERLFIEGIDEGLLVLLGIFEDRHTPFQNLSFVADSCDILSDAIGHIPALVRRSIIVDQLEITYSGVDDTEIVDLARISEAVSDPYNSLRSLTLRLTSCQQLGMSELLEAVMVSSSLRSLDICVDDFRPAAQTLILSLPYFQLKRLHIQYNDTFEHNLPCTACDETVSNMVKALSQNFEIEDMIFPPLVSDCDDDPMAMRNRYLCRSNKGGRRLFREAHRVPAALWPTVLARVNSLTFGVHDDAVYQAEILYDFIRGPLLSFLH